MLQLWAAFEEPKEVTVESEPIERQVEHKTVLITEIMDSGNFYAQNVETGMFFKQ